jgi:cystathionine gamma-synthase
MSDAEDHRSIVRRTRLPESASRPVVTPVYPSAVYAAESPDALDALYEGGAEGYAYAREGHPNADVLAAKIDWLEGAEGGLIAGSGMGAISAVLLGLLAEGDHVVGGTQLYGRTLRLMRQDLPRMGFDVSLADTTDASAVEAVLRPETRMIVVETISNPTLRVADIEAIVEIARAHDILVVVDNTFTTPRAFRPFDYGADIVVHSVTKLLAGHSDVTLGYVAARGAEDRAAIYDAIASFGFTPSPFDCWLAERGLHSFALRFDRAQENAAELAQNLAAHPDVARVIHPALPDHPDHARAAHLFGGLYGNMLSFEIRGGRAAANALVRAAPHIPFAPTLGDIGTTLSHPLTSSHRALRAREREELGLSEGFFRVSVGIEDVELLKQEFDNAISAAARVAGAAPDAAARRRAGQG